MAGARHRCRWAKAHRRVQHQQLRALPARSAMIKWKSCLSDLLEVCLDAEDLLHRTPWLQESLRALRSALGRSFIVLGVHG